jgi:N-acetylmuramoyl-L-alanine amidase
MPASLTPVRIRVIAVLVILGFGGLGIALARGGDSPRRRVTVATSTSAHETTTTRAPVTTAAPTTTTAPTTTAATTTSTATVRPLATTPPTAPPPAPVVNTALGSLRGRTIAIDPGHDGGNYAHASEIGRPIFIGTQTRACDTTGTQTNDGYTEAAYNLDVALRLRDMLQAAGANVVMTRATNDGWGPCIDERAAIGNRADADAAISIHADGGPAGGRGFHVLMPGLVAGYTDDIYSASHALGVDVRDAFLATGMPTSTYYASGGLAERTDLGGLNLSNVPKVFVETGNMRNATDAALLESSEFRQREAQALAAGLDRFLAP